MKAIHKVISGGVPHAMLAPFRNMHVICLPYPTVYCFYDSWPSASFSIFLDLTKPDFRLVLEFPPPRSRPLSKLLQDPTIDQISPSH